jgi:bifunctional non-homologous end joining protein LigD
MPCDKDRPPPSGGLWLHEIKHDGFRVIARKDGAKVRLYSRPGNDLTFRFRLIVESMARLRSRSCIIDGEAVACNDNGLASFDRIRYRRHDATVFLYAFDLIELNGDDLRRDPLEVRKEQSVEPLSCWGFVRPRGAKNSMISIFYARGGSRIYKLKM